MKIAILSLFKTRYILNILLCLLTMSSFSHANVVKTGKAQKIICTNYPANLWKGLIAEAAGEKYIGLYAVACCVRNRLAAKMNHGLVGMERKDLELFIKHEYKVRHWAHEAIQAVFEYNGTDTTNGALYFESIDFIKNFKEWSKNKVILAHIGKHYFYNYRR